MLLPFQTHFFKTNPFQTKNRFGRRIRFSVFSVSMICLKRLLQIFQSVLQGVCCVLRSAVHGARTGSRADRAETAGEEHDCGEHDGDDAEHQTGGSDSIRLAGRLQLLTANNRENQTDDGNRQRKNRELGAQERKNDTDDSEDETGGRLTLSSSLIFHLQISSFWIFLFFGFLVFSKPLKLHPNM